MTATIGPVRHSTATDLRVADAIDAHVEELATGWTARHLRQDALRHAATEQLGADTAAAYHRDWAAPMLRVLAGALRGTPGWLPVYQDERRRYLRTDEALLADLFAADETEILVLAGVAVGETPGLRLAHTARQSSTVPLRVALVGDCVMTEVRAFLDSALEPAGLTVAATHEYFSASQGVSPTLHRTVADVAAGQVDVVALSPATFEAFPAYVSLLADARAFSADQLRDRVTAFVAMVRGTLADLRAAGDTTVLLHIPCGLPLHGARRRLSMLPPLSGAQRRVLGAVRAALVELAEATPNVIALDEEVVVAPTGLRAAGESLFPGGVLSDAVFHTSRFGPLLAEAYAPVLRAYRALAGVKVLCVDFDNTLWRGVMAEGAVEHHLDRQRLLAQLRSAGILLVAVSKNTPSSLRWSEIELAESDFVLRKIGWDQKSTTIAEAAAQLNLGLDSFVLIDDNPAERAMVSSTLPAVRTMDADDAFTWQALRWLLDFPATGSTEEARSRTESYRAAAERREALVEGLDYPAMMRDLALRVEWEELDEAQLPRAVELLARTNQMNTTTRRQSAQDLRALMADPDAEVLRYGLADRFGDLGIVGITVTRREAERTVLDSLVMSCRAMGFGMEQLMTACAVRTTEAGSPVLAQFRPTERNSPAAAVFAGSGFRPAGEDWIIDAAAEVAPIPDWFEVRGPRS